MHMPFICFVENVKIQSRHYILTGTGSAFYTNGLMEQVIFNGLKDADYLKASQQEQELCSQYENLNLSDDQQKVIINWIEAIHAQNEAYTTVVFRTAMQCCFALLLELADLK